MRGGGIAALRASLGHPDPFKLRFVEIGNEVSLVIHCRTTRVIGATPNRIGTVLIFVSSLGLLRIFYVGAPIEPCENEWHRP